MIKFSENLKQLRLQRGLSRNALAKALGVTYDKIYRWETNPTRVELENIAKIAKFFNVKIDTLLGFDK